MELVNPLRYAHAHTYTFVVFCYCGIFPAALDCHSEQKIRKYEKCVYLFGIISGVIPINLFTYCERRGKMYLEFA